MTDKLLPLLCEAAQLAEKLSDPHLIVIDLSKPEDYNKGHIPGAYPLQYADILGTQKPVMGLLPEPQQFARVLSSMGWTPESHIVACDNEGGGHASRLLWTLEVAGITRYSLLNGGMHAWLHAELPLSTEIPEPGNNSVEISWRCPEFVADREFILAHLDDPDTKVVDARSPAEYAGTDVRANRGGHIPGAVNLNWLDIMDRDRQLRLKPDPVLQQMLAQLDIRPQQDIINYCHTHHRSALNWLMLKHLGYKKIRGYPGSWSDWGNHPDTPIEP